MRDCNVNDWRFDKIQTMLVRIVTIFKEATVITRLSLVLALLLGWTGIAHANGSDFSLGVQTRTADIQAGFACGGSDGDKKNPP
ncbi:MAG: hypothetical protein IPL51_07110 [Candidatus Competibacteraceae bacterium]|nr:hypothetical protein [Candidatus Competibacteraceae bacterium]